jgi:hypothetical protein
VPGVRAVGNPGRSPVSVGDRVLVLARDAVRRLRQGEARKEGEVKTATYCGVVIYDQRRNEIRTCGAKTTHVLTFNGDHLFSICPRHNRRLDRALPGMEKVP